jgi:uncharacterized protein
MKLSTHHNAPNTQTRRQFLLTASAVTASIAWHEAGHAEPRPETEKRSMRHRGLIDTNITLSLWPGRRLPLDDTKALLKKLRHEGVTQAWAGTFDGLLHKDIASANAWLAAECHQHGHGLLIPFGSINPRLSGWQEDLRRCAQEHRMPGIRLHPNYHGYKLSEPIFYELLRAATGQGLIVQVALVMEDERMQHRLMQVPHVDAEPLPGILKSLPAARVQLLNWFRAAKFELLAKLAAAGNAVFDIATLEGVGGVENLLKQIPVNRVVFGSYSPFFYFEASALKLRESRLDANATEAVSFMNAQAMLGRRVDF